MKKNMSRVFVCEISSCLHALLVLLFLFSGGGALTGCAVSAVPPQARQPFSTANQPSPTARRPSAQPYAETVRVLVLTNEDFIRIEGAKIEGVKDGGAANIEARGGGMALNGEPVGGPRRFYPTDEFVYIGDKPFRGVIEVRADKDGLMVINEIPLESYIAGIINNEISSRWPVDAIKAQAVIARTYSLYQKAKRNGAAFDLTGTHMDQVYTGAGAEDAAALRAVKETVGEVLFHDGSPALTVYHSNAGGMTEASRDVWGSDYPYLRALNSKYDSVAPSYSWELSLSAAKMQEIFKKAGYSIDEPEAIEPREVTSTGRVKSLFVKDIFGRRLDLTGEDMRKVIGYSTLRSTLFKVEKRGDEFVFRGRGSGHGVGLSQWGAKGMADAGYGYREILKYYYPGTVLRRVY
ncbi:MAG: SpoIID/LytB domain-containing protein [Deltaproteobacteria bacterium]|nr:SpoIID/LytB domain-containing protein [Deltaproteobacteria bacterium]